MSLLTQELNNSNDNYYNGINIKNISNNFFEKNIEKIIEKKIVNNSICMNECSLNIHSFNPTKNSPPNEWQFRLIKRINSFNSLNDN